MSELQQFVLYIQNTVGVQNDKATQKKCEEAIKQLIESNPNQFILHLLSIIKLQNEIEENIRTFAASMIRKHLSLFSEMSFKCVWDQLNQQTQQLVKQTLFEMLQLEKKHSIRSLLCDAIGEIGASLIQDEAKNEWPELINLTWGLFAQDNQELIEAGFKILSNLLTFALDRFAKYKSELHILFKSGMQQPNDSTNDKNKNKNFARIRHAAVESFASYVEQTDTRSLSPFSDLIPIMLEAILTNLRVDPDIGEETLNSLSNMVEADPKFFKKQFEILFQSMLAVFQMPPDDIDIAVKRFSTEIIILMIERLPSVIRSKNDLLNQLVELIFWHMIQIDQQQQPDASWCRPKEGFNEDQEEQDEELEVTQFGMNSIDKLISAIGEKETLPIISNTVAKLLQNQQDWRHQFAAIMALSQVGEYIDEVAEVQPIVSAILKFLDSQIPRLRYAVCHAIGQISDDMKPDFQKAFHQTVMPLLIKTLEDPIPRVASHALAAITNFTEEVNKEITKDYIQLVLQKSFALMSTQNCCSLVKENAVSTIAAIAESSKDFFHPYFQQSIEYLFNLYNSHGDKVYRQLRGQIIETITLIAHSVSKDLFRPYFPSIANILINLQSSGVLELVDPQKAYILSGWQRLSLAYPDEMSQNLPQVMPTLFKLVAQIFQAENSLDADIAQSYDAEEAEISIHMIQAFVEQLKERYMPYVEDTIKLIEPLCNYTKNDKIREAASMCLPGLIACLKDNQELKKKVAILFMQILCKAAEVEYETSVILSQVQAMNSCMEQAGQFLTQEQINEFTQKIFDLLLQSDTRKAQNEQEFIQSSVEEAANSGQIDKDEEEVFKEDLREEEDLQIAIAGLIGMIFQTHPDQSVPIANIIYTTILPKAFQQNSSIQLHVFGLYLINDMIKYLGFQRVGDKWPFLLEAQLKFSVHQNLEIRICALYGLKLFIKKTPQPDFPQFLQHITKTVGDVLAIQLNKEKDKENIYQKSRDNAIAILGTLLQYQAANLNQEITKQVVQVWIDYLPIRRDKQVAIKQHEFLVQTVIQMPQLIFFQEQNFIKVIKIFGTIIDTKVSNGGIKNNISKALKQLSQYQYVQQNWQAILTNLDDLQKKRLEDCSKLNN